MASEKNVLFCPLNLLKQALLNGGVSGDGRSRDGLKLPNIVLVYIVSVRGLCWECIVGSYSLSSLTS
jgi:hypothetical protein